jgi:hypothetical protein
MVLKNLFGKADIKPLHFGRKVSAGTEGRESYDIKKDATIEMLEFRIYSGAEDTLKLNAYIEDEETNSKKQIIETPDDQAFIGGNEDFFTFRATESVTSDDRLVIEYENTDTTNPHRYKMNVELDRTGGKLSNLLR